MDSQLTCPNLYSMNASPPHLLFHWNFHEFKIPQLYSRPQGGMALLRENPAGVRSD